MDLGQEFSFAVVSRHGEITFSESENTCIRSMGAKSFPEMNCLRNAFVLSRSFPISLSRFPTFFGKRYAPGSVSERNPMSLFHFCSMTDSLATFVEISLRPKSLCEMRKYI